MIVTKEFLEREFRRFNSEIFGEELPEPRFVITSAGSFRGKLAYRFRHTSKGVEAFDFELRLSRTFDLPEREWEDVVIHEMIHLHIASNGIPDRSAHGPAFRKLMNTINRRHGRKIEISHRASISKSAETQTGGPVRAHYICLARFNDGRLGVAPLAKTRIFRLWNHFETFSGVARVKWIGSVDNWFNAFPHVLQPKLFIMQEEEVLPHLKGAVLLERKGNKIEIVSRRCSPAELLP